MSEEVNNQMRKWLERRSGRELIEGSPGWGLCLGKWGLGFGEAGIPQADVTKTAGFSRCPICALR